MEKAIARAKKPSTPTAMPWIAVGRQALTEHNAQIHHVPLHRQMIPWGMRANVTVVHRADNVLNFGSVRID